MRRAASIVAPALLAGLAAAGAEQGVSFAEGLGALVRHAEAGELEEALAVGASLAEDADALGLGEVDRAALAYARGVCRARGGTLEEREEAIPFFESARALAGPGRLRLDATYDLGWVRLAEAEHHRALLPEVSGAAAPAPGQPPLPGQAPAPVPGAPAGAPDGGASADPLPLARAAYEAARETLVERLRADWRHPDTRANLELIQRRLAELDEIERQREEQQQQDQENQEPSQDEQEQQQDSGREGEPDESQEPEENQQGESQEEGERQEDPSAQPEPGEDEPGEDQAPADEASGEREQEQQPEPTGAEEEPSQQAEPAEGALTDEEVMRLLDRLAELEEKAREIEARMRASRRVPVERDW